MKFYEVCYSESKHDPFTTISYHSTKTGAYIALRKYLEKLYDDWYEERIKYGKEYYYTDYYWQFHDFRIFERTMML